MLQRDFWKKASKVTQTVGLLHDFGGILGYTTDAPIMTFHLNMI